MIARKYSGLEEPNSSINKYVARILGWRLSFITCLQKIYAYNHVTKIKQIKLMLTSMTLRRSVPAEQQFRQLC